MQDNIEHIVTHGIEIRKELALFESLPFQVNTFEPFALDRRKLHAFYFTLRFENIQGQK